MTFRSHARRLPLLILLLAALQLLVSGCGGGPSKQEYEDGLKRMQGQLAEANDASRASAETTDAEQRREQLREAERAIADAAKTARSLEPPDDARAAHDKLAAALADYAELFGKLADVETGAENESELYTQAGAIVKELDDANRELEQSGYSTKDT